ncbi:hypothetical protein KR018_006480, partial [Drosophila ironensis]
DVPDVNGYQKLMDLRSLSSEFFRAYQNFTANDLDLFEGRIGQKDLSTCAADMAQWMNDLASPKLYALMLLDAWGSIPSGFLYGNRIDFGNYDQCLWVNKAISDTRRIKGKYCLLKLPIAKWMGFNAELLDYVSMRIAMCFPSSCPAAVIETLMQQMIKQILGVSGTTNLLSIDESTCKVNESRPYDAAAIVTIVLLSVFGGVAVLCTLYDYFLVKDQSKLPPFVRVFSIRANSRSVFAVTNPKSSPNVIHCLNGMRCLSLIWVILGHEYTVTLFAQAINQIESLRWMSKPFTSFIIYAPFSVDTFFFLSGLLLVAIGMRALERTKGKMNVPLMYVHRYLRLTPILGVAILVYTSLLPHLTDGPLYDELGFFDYSACKKTWYWTLLYFQNYAGDSTEMCLPHSWYLAVDMQLYLLSPILLFGLYKWGRKAAGGILVLMLLLSGCLFATIMVNDYMVVFINGGQSPDVQKHLYFATHVHAAPWLIGTIFGYLIHRTRGQKINLNPLAIWAGWVFALGLMFTCIFAMLPYAKLLGKSPTVLEGAFFYTFTRMAWPLALCWVVFACVQGFGGLANSFLSSPLWQPLSRLSYSAYIWHIFIMEINHRRLRTNTHFSDYDAMLNFWGGFGFTLLMSYVLYVIIEAPLGGLEGMLLPTRRQPSKPEVQADVQTKKE